LIVIPSKRSLHSESLPGVEGIRASRAMLPALSKRAEGSPFFATQ